MTMTSTFTTMFNRLPIYTRPKEPAIGYPVLTESTNTNLTGHIIGLDGRPIPTPLIGGSPYNVGYKIASFKGLPDIPSLSNLSDSPSDSEDDLRPPPPLRINTLAYPPPSSSSSSLKSHASDMTFRAAPPRRKPAPTTAKPPTDPARPSFRRKLNITPPPPVMDPLEAPSPVAVVKPPNFVSIDDWLDTREREGLHRRSNTITTVASQATRYNEPLRLHLRQSTFAPLPAPHELAPPPPETIPALPPIPAQYQTLVPPQHPLSPPRTPPPPPRDHIEQLEYEQEQLTTRKSAVKREMWDLRQLLPPNPSTHNPIARGDMNRRVQELERELADVEKECHEVGMKLHRAWRRRDRKMGREGPTHLWVSRVSGGA